MWNEFTQPRQIIINQGTECEFAVAHVYFDVLDRMAVLDRDLQETITPPLAEGPVAPPVTVNYEEHETNVIIAINDSITKVLSSDPNINSSEEAQGDPTAVVQDKPLPILTVFEWPVARKKPSAGN
ncbi:hypothetical protein OSTOST_23897 [Ostertagia ostertagi]